MYLIGLYRGKTRRVAADGGYRRTILLLAVLTACGILSAGAQKRVTEPAAGAAPTVVAIFYDGPDAPLAEGYLDARHIENLLGHFGLAGEIVPIAGYRPGQLARYRSAFFVGATSGTKFPPGFLEDVRNYGKPFCWVGMHLDRLLDTPELRRRFGIAYIDYRDDLEFRQVQYKGVALPKEDPDLNLVSIVDRAAAEVRATAINQDKISYPYAMRHNRFWYVADIPFSFNEEGGRYLVFCDLLHDILEISHAASSRALVRIEDVSTDIDPGDLRGIADLLARRNVPFQVGVIPVYRKPSQGIEVRLTDRPAFVEALQYMVARGGTPILHGGTHQYRGTTGDDFEFWNGIENRPVAGDSAEYVLDKLRLGIGESFAAGIFPVAFETPHYAASETDYQAMKGIFPLFYERTMATPDISATQYFPYPVVDRFGRRVLPEDLGFLPEDHPDPQALIARARNLRVVRDGIASFYFHPFLDPALLDTVVRGIAELGYRFVSLREFGGGLNLEGRSVVATASGRIRVSPNNEYWRARVYDRAGKLLRDDSSKERLTGPVEVPVEIPSGGWAALECRKEKPGEAPVAGWSERFKGWWAEYRPNWARGDAGKAAPPRSAWLLWADQPGDADRNNQQSYQAVLESFGYPVKIVRLAGWSAAPREPGTIVVAPEAAGARLSESQKQMILRYVSAGGALVADGRQPWLSAIGFRWSGWRIPVNAVVDVLFPEMPLRWQPEELVERFTPPEGARQLMVDPESRQVLATAGKYGSGSYLYLAAPLDPHTADATSHYPYFAEYLTATFERRNSLRSARLEVYFDPGYRQGVDLSRLVTFWRQNGIRTVYAAAWQFYPGYSFDYERLIRLAHQNGLAVYAWFVLPEVTPRMWQEHPEWRERTATGADGNVGWRLLMNLEDPDCFQATMEWMKQLLSAYEWDGVNLAELNFDADFTDYLRPDRFVPMNEQVRADFSQRSGFDPALLFAPGSPYDYRQHPEALEKLLAYREDLVTELHRRVLKELEPLGKERGWETIVTMLDSLHSDYVRPALGVNSRRIVDLMSEFDFTLQVEDPAEHWTAPPERYRTFARAYLALIPDRRRLMFDVNVMANRDVSRTTLPARLATGTELARTVAAAAAASGRAALYSESTVASQDWALLSEALAAAAQHGAPGQERSVNSRTPVRWLPAEDRDYYLDGQPWPAVSGDGVLVPAGRHSLSRDRPWYRFLERGEMPARLLNMSADLLEARLSPTGMALRYSAPSRAVILLNQRPQGTYLDGRATAVPAQPGGGNWWIIAPRGEHQIEIVTASQAGVFVNVWSWLSASAISTFGGLATFCMAGIYLYIRLRRFARRGGTA